MDHGWSCINHPSVAFTGKALHATTDLPDRQPGYIQDPSEGSGRFRAFFFGVARDAAAALACA
jgi:hypothetical protein